MRAIPSTLVVAVVAVVALLPQLSRPGPQMDEGIVLAYASRILQGAVPYRDFQEFYGPGNLWTVAAAFAAFGERLEVERLVGLSYVVLTVASIYVVARRLNREAAWVSAFLMLAIASDGGVWAYTTRGAVAFLALGIVLGTADVARSRQRQFCALGAGLAAGLALLYRYDFILPVALSGAVVLHRMDKRSRFSYVGGALAITLCYVPCLVLAGASGIRRSIREVREVPAGRHLPIPGPLHFPAGPLLVGAAVALVVLLAAGTTLARRRDSAGRAALAVALASVGAIPFVIQRADAIHIESIAILAYGMLPVSWVVLRERLRTNTLLRRTAGVLVGLSLIWGVGEDCVLFVDTSARSLSLRESTPSAVDVTNRGRTFIFANAGDAAQAQHVVSMADRLARAGDSLFVGPADLRRAFYGPSYLYFLLPELRPASYFMQFAPWTANRPGSGLARDVARADWLILVSKWDAVSEPNTSRRLGSPLPNEVVRRQFCVVVRDGSYELLRHRGPRLPC